jgi:hypothetical protein
MVTASIISSGTAFAARFTLPTRERLAHAVGVDVA